MPAPAMTGSDLAQWHDLFVAVAGAAAALAGLIFVAVSINLEHILSTSRLAPLAAEPLVVLMSLLFTCVLGLVPGQSARLLGGELCGLGLLLAGVLAVLVVRRRNVSGPRRWLVQFSLVAGLSCAPLIVGGALLTLRTGAGLDWIVAEVLLGFTASVYNAWVLLVEIRR